MAATTTPPYTPGHAPPATVQPNVTLNNWISVFLKSVGAPDTPSNEAKIRAWELAEGGITVEHANNPENTTRDAGVYTQRVPGTAIPVYPSLAIGVEETANTLLGSNPAYGYAPIVANLQTGGTLQDFVRSVMSSSWAGGHYAGTQFATLANNGASTFIPTTASPTTGGGAVTPNGGSSSSTVDASTAAGIGGTFKSIAIRLIEVLGGLVLIFIGVKLLGTNLSGLSRLVR